MVGVLARPIICRLLLLISALLLFSGHSNAKISSDDSEETEVLLKQLAELKDVNALSISPDKRWALVQERAPNTNNNSYRLRWYLIDLFKEGAVHHDWDGGRPIIAHLDVVPTGFFSNAKPIWSRTSNWFLFLKRDGENVGVWRGSTENIAPKNITNMEGKISNVRLSSDETQILYELRPTAAQLKLELRAEYRNGFLYNSRFIPYLNTLPLSSRPVLAPSPFSTVDAVAPAMWVTEILSGQSQAVSSNDGIVFPVTPAMEAQSFAGSKFIVKGPIAILKKGRAAAWTEALDPDLQGVRAPTTVAAQFKQGDRIICGFGACTGEVTGMWWMDEEKIIFTRKERAPKSVTFIYTWNPKQNDLQMIMKTSDTYVECSPSKFALICFHESPKQPRKLVSINPNDGSVSTILNPNSTFPALNNINVTELSVDIDGDVVTTAMMAWPKDEIGPLVVNSYNCDGFLKGGTGDEYPILPLVARGFSVMCFRIPPETAVLQREKDILEYVKRQSGPGLPGYDLAHKALDRAVKIAETRKLAVTKNRAITGLSHGASTAWYELGQHGYKTAIVSSGTYGHAGNALGGEYTNRLLDGWGMDERFFDEIIDNVENIRAPVLMNVSEHELLTSLDSYKSLQDNNVPVELFLHANEYHVKAKPSHRLAIYERNVDWLRFWLKNEEDTDPRKKDQYQRWHKMKDQQTAEHIRLKSSE